MKHYAPEGLLDYCETALSNESKPRALAYLAIQCAVQPYKHALDLEAIPCSKEYLRSLKVSTQDIKDSGCFEFINAQPSKVAAGIKLKPGIRLDIKPEPSTVVDINTGAKKRKPQSAIDSRDANDSKATYRNPRIEVAQPIDIAGLQRLSEDTEATPRERASAALMAASSSDGKFLQHYQESAAGRLYGQGNNLQNVPKLVRRTALSTGTELDMVNAHPTILNHLAAGLGVHAPTLRAYVDRPSDTRHQLAEELGITYDGAKRVLLAATFLGHPAKSLADIVKDCGGDPGKLKDVDQVRQYQQEIRKIAKELFGKGSKGQLVNVLGKSISSSEKDSRKLAHIVQGLEVLALHAMIEGLEVLSLEHDGATVGDREVDLEEVGDRINQKTGIGLKVEEKS